MRAGCDHALPNRNSFRDVHIKKKEIEMHSYDQDVGGLAALAVHVWFLQLVDLPDKSVKTLLHCFRGPSLIRAF
jgi:hypothetical protein